MISIAISSAESGTSQATLAEQCSFTFISAQSFIFPQYYLGMQIKAFEGSKFGGNKIGSSAFYGE